MKKRKMMNNTAINTGFHSLDSLSVGFIRRGYVSAVLSEPSIGKTGFCLSLADHMIEASNLNVLYISIERNREMICSLFDKISINQKKSRRGSISFVSPDSPDIEEIERIIADSNPDVVFIDYLGIIRKEDGDSVRQHMLPVVLKLQKIAKECNVAIVALQQVPRENNTPVSAIEIPSISLVLERDRHNSPERLDVSVYSSGVLVSNSIRFYFNPDTTAVSEFHS